MECLKRNGCLYCWPTKQNGYSGKDLKSAKYQNVYDCSGLVTASLFAATGTDWRATHNAQKLAQNSDFVKPNEMMAGDLVFYGADHNHISHVMVYLGRKHAIGILATDTIYGASGGNSKTVTPEIAMKQDAKVRAYRTINYRPDFVSCGRVRI